MDNKYKDGSREPNTSLARPYVNNQTFTKMYNLSSALEYGTLFPELYLLDSLTYNKDLYSTPKKRSGGRK